MSVHLRGENGHAFCRFLHHVATTDEANEVTCQACLSKLRRLAEGDDGQGRLRRAVYLPPECWTWLEETAAHDGTQRSDVLEGLVLLAMDEAEDKARGAG